MLYLAEVKNQTRGFVGGSKTELKLLAAQNPDQTWSAVTGEELVVSDSISEQTSKGSLFIINLDSNNQIQGNPELAGSRLVNYLKHFSRILEKSKSQEEEIEQWKLSLRIQSEEIAKRQTELDSQQEQLQEKEIELARLQEERDKLHDAWQQFREDQRKLQANLVAEGDKLEIIKSLLQKFSGFIVDADSLKQEHQKILASINNQQSNLDRYWQELEQQKHQIQQQQRELDDRARNVEKRRQELNLTQDTLQRAKLDLEIQETLLNAKEQLLGQITIYLEGIEYLYQEVAVLSDDGDDAGHNIDFNALESMPLGELENTVNELQQETQKLVNFVNMQEEELTLQMDEVKKIEEKLAQANEIDKLSLETELADAREAMKLLDETLVGQRRTLKKQEQIFNRHLKILNRRKGIFDLASFDAIDLNPILRNIEQQRHNTENQRQAVESEIQNLKHAIAQIKPMVEQQNNTYRQQEGYLKQDEHDWQQSYLNLRAAQARVDFLEKALHPLQERLNEIRTTAETMETFVNNIEQSRATHHETVQKIEAIVREIEPTLE